MQLRRIAFGGAGLLPLALIGCACGSSGIGHAADRAKATRVLEVRALDSNRFEPDAFRVSPGETVTFRVTNAGTEIHEFVLADKKGQDEHEREMAAMGDQPMQMPDEEHEVSLDPGATKELTWTFPDKGTIQFACHEPDHYVHGMFGSIKVG